MVSLVLSAGPTERSVATGPGADEDEDEDPDDWSDGGELPNPSGLSSAAWLSIPPGSISKCSLGISARGPSGGG